MPGWNVKPMNYSRTTKGLSLLGAICALALVNGCGSTTTTVTTTASSATSAVPATTTASSASTPTSTSPSATRAGQSTPLGTLAQYWRSISAHEFATAYTYLVPGSVAQAEPQFVSDEQQAGIQSVQFRGRLGSIAGSSATVDVASLITNDAQFGCRTWTGSYELTYQNGRWLINRANITPASCTSPQPPAAQTGPVATSGPSSPQSVEGPGSYSHATDTAFCSTHQCIQNFPNGSGYIVQCVDGKWSHSGGLSGACSYHGGES